jgi:hypothetical protein
VVDCCNRCTSFVALQESGYGTKLLNARALVCPEELAKADMRPFQRDSAFDPSATLAVHRGNGFYARFEPYQSTRLSRYNTVLLSLGANMRRREFITLLGGVAAAWPLAARAQQGDGMRRIGVLMGSAESDQEGQARVAAFREGLRKLGWAEGRNIQIDYRWATPVEILMI